eukprot:TRINITY_DN44_c1_g1_i2.p2 TRINITY_DN44_c1_g1~~TRINITY_DN44_c1_g1_i2.p2  ORF type:complete len:116 (+),score=0.39 TRINITY_DN44_c1_g1_i2:3-350(+)
MDLEFRRVFFGFFFFFFLNQIIRISYNIIIIIHHHHQDLLFYQSHATPLVQTTRKITIKVQTCQPCTISLQVTKNYKMIKLFKPLKKQQKLQNYKIVNQVQYHLKLPNNITKTTK